MSQFAKLKPKTTTNQARASAGKRQRQAAKKEDYARRATALGVTVAELKMIEAHESEEASARQRALARLNKPAPTSRPHSWRWPTLYYED